MRVSYTVTYKSPRSCDVVYSKQAIRRVARGHTIDRVYRNVSRWEGSWESGSRSFERVSTEELSPLQY